MALPGSGTITFAQIRAEIGGSGAIVIPSAEVRTLTGVASGPIVCPTDFYGKSSGAPSGTTLLSQTTAGAWTYTHTYGTQSVTIEIWGGGGAGCLHSTGGKAPVFTSGGGGGGGYSSETYTIANGGTISGTVGDGGTAPAGTNFNGTSGAASDCTQTSQTANGGVFADAFGSRAGAGGTASGGDTNTTGTAGVANSYGGGSPNGGANQTSSATGNAPGGGGYVAGGGAIGKVLVKAV